MLADRLRKAASAPATAAFADSAVDTANATEYTFSGASTGTASAARRVVVATYGGSGTRSVSSMTINGVSAAQDHSNVNGAETTEIWSAVVPTGTTGDIVVTWSGSQVACSIGVWAIYGAESTAHATGESDAATGSDTIDCPAGGVVVGFRKSGGGVTHTWSGIDEDFDATVEGTTTHTGAFKTFAATQTGLSVTCTPSGASGTPAMILASWGPL